ncbi:High-affnity carbon uptake protein Hat/HatR [Enhygromyxa salina]|uniref:High-affnity carbon uptake protein Hat/HatR n=1 Tax=Enhygromyxa salina TaxID=215803 RepID=A0A0C1ZVQ6_9BACT|nr:serine/threonine-protein kinase [Enhygromyxa salina]KIG15138.1 High-affnity carbon uptake protein Hat/HatR [Enhygromyxa salina]
MSESSDNRTLDADPANPSTRPVKVSVELSRGESLGRYLIVDVLGSGGMGKVYAAYDPELNRKLAIKLLHHAPGTEASRAASMGSSRLLREAQAMAKLSHTNVVTVHDVGTHAGRVFVAMEYVEGSNLEHWLDAAPEGRPHPWREVLARFLPAGRGLAAAHAAELIHRDFKPANVLLGADGRVRVADFGLARRAGDEGPTGAAIPPNAGVDAATLVDSLSLRLTQTGAFVGTPAYMAPEQFRGSELDARSDQFSFCVALWEGLYGERPFAGDSAAAILFSIHEHQLREPPPAAAAKVPSWLRRVLERGLANEPSARWPNMDSLLRALSKDPAVGRRRIGAAVLGLAALAAAVIGPQLREQPQPPPPPPPPPPLCQGAEAALGEAWDADQRERLHARYAKLNERWAADDEARLISQLDAWAAGWIAAWTDACAATRIRGEQSEDKLDDRMLCLQRRRSRLETFIESIETTPDKQLRKAPAQVDDIGDVADCSDPEAMHARIPPPADTERRAEFERLLEEFDAVTVQRSIGRYDLAKTRLEPAYAAALATEHPTLITEARAVRGDLLAQLEDPQAEPELVLAYESALAAGLFGFAARAAQDLAVYLMAFDERRAEAERWLRTAEALVTYLDDQTIRMFVLESRARLERYRGNYPEALAWYQRAVDLSTEVNGADAKRTADALFNLSTVLFEAGNISEAKQTVGRAEAIWADELGPLDPRSLAALNASGVFAWRMGDARTARESFEELLARREQLFGPDHPEVGDALFNYGSMLVEFSAPHAREPLERLLAIHTRHYGPESIAVAHCKANLAKAVIVEDPTDLATARRLIDEAIATVSKERDAAHLELLIARGIRLEVLRRGGDYRAALAEAAVLQRLFERADTAVLSNVADLYVELAYIALGQGRSEQALANAEKAAEFSTQEATGPRKTAERELVTAQVLRELGRTELANAARARARAAYLRAQAGLPGDPLWDAIDGWVDAPE